MRARVLEACTWTLVAITDARWRWDHAHGPAGRGAQGAGARRARANMRG